MQESPRVGTSNQIGSKGKRLLMGHPAGQFRLQSPSQVGIDPYERVSRPAAEPFQAAADVNIDAERRTSTGIVPTAW